MTAIASSRKLAQVTFQALPHLLEVFISFHPTVLQSSEGGGAGNIVPDHQGAEWLLKVFDDARPSLYRSYNAAPRISSHGRKLKPTM